MVAAPVRTVWQAKDGADAQEVLALRLLRGAPPLLGLRPEGALVGLVRSGAGATLLVGSARPLVPAALTVCPSLSSSRVSF
jgi:hypothetical protein